MQCTMSEVCAFLEICEETLNIHCKKKFGAPWLVKYGEWREGGKCSLRRNQWILSKSNAAMAIFLGKQYLKQTDDYKVNHKGHLGVQVVNYGAGPIEPWKATEDKA